ncbi:MAG: DnaJ domain-containing protein [Alphaproteobacteria bacterium]|nr:DnaJ domain-containing protein [Alphaproteobacteria bacterium]
MTPLIIYMLFGRELFRSPKGFFFIRSAYLEVSLNSSGNFIRVNVISGRYFGRKFQELSGTDFLNLHADLERNNDELGLFFLEKYMDLYVSGWRDSEENLKPEHGSFNPESKNRKRSSSGSMTVMEAYEMLGLSSNATPEEIKSAHRALMKIIHPDHGGTSHLAGLINQARDILMKRP